MGEPQVLTVFENERIAAAGADGDVSAWVRRASKADPDRSYVVIDDATGRVVDIDLREPSAPPPPRGRGRPRLGVSSREITLLPRHWEWLAAQPGGASVTLRRLVEQARKTDAGAVHAARETAYRAMTTLAGDRAGYEDAVRALYAGDTYRFCELTEPWPQDIRNYVRRLASMA
jgi:hypothetical protein